MRGELATTHPCVTPSRAIGASSGVPRNAIGVAVLTSSVLLLGRGCCRRTFPG